MESTKDAPTPASGNNNVKNLRDKQNELSGLEAYPPANRPSHLEHDGKWIKWNGLTILNRTGKMPRFVKSDGMQACSSRKAKLVELSDDETPVERSCEVVDLESSKCEKQTCETEVLSSSTCFNTMGLIKKRKGPESQETPSSSVPKANKGSGGGDNKEASASAFLNQVKEKLSTEEYKKFIGYMQALKNKEIKLASVMQSIVQLFCGKERDHLLMGFKDFVPVKFRPAYEQSIKMRKREEA